MRMTGTWQVTDAISVPVPAALAVCAALVALLLVVVVVLRRRRTAKVSAAPASAEGAAIGVQAPMRRGLARTRSSMLQRLLPLLGRNTLDPGDVETLEAVLLGADVGVKTTARLLGALRKSDADGTLTDRLAREALTILQSSQPREDDAARSQKPLVIMVVGVNGVGKTTSIGKLAARFQKSGKRTLLVAGDTFRAAAIEQLAVWADRTGADLVRHQHGGDPGAVAYDGVRAGVAREADVVIVDTAGRLHTKSNLMDELRKVRRVIARELPGAPHETLLVVDAVTGQNGLAQARAFLEELAVTGVVLTKLDGTAKGGIVLAIAGELGLPIRYVGIGEGVDDLRDFDPAAFVEALLDPTEVIDLP
jgi:fused signal recognition particle receptor